MPINSVYIHNYKSIRDSGVIPIYSINILIGSNGVGKSNFISFFKLLNQIYERQLQRFVAQSGYADKMLYFGRRNSKFIEGGVIFKNENGRPNNRYDFKLVPDQNNSFYFESEKGGFNSFTKGYGENWDYLELETIGKPESGLKEHGATRFDFIRKYFDDFNVFHFHDTSASALLKQPSKSRDYEYFKSDGSNIAAFLYMLRERYPKNYKIIEYTIRSVAPFFDRFNLAPDAINPEVMFLNWIELNSEEYFNAHNFSDGTLRFIALATLLLQPNLPKTIIIDEPELGLHPSAIIKLGAMIKSASTKAQIIISTQSVNLLDQFLPEDIIVVERADEQTVFKRLNDSDLKEWLNEYSIGELWGKNVLGGTP